jgi:hypothetical protein
VKDRAPFGPADLAELDMRLLDQASAVIAMEDVYDGHRDPNSIGLRHDVDGISHNTQDALETAVNMAGWEAERGYRASYYLLHTAPYWNTPGFREAVDTIAGYGHEIGIHNNAIAEALRTGEDPDLILDQAISTLRGFGYPVRGAVGHGDPCCNREAQPGEAWFANDEQFTLCRRTDYGAPNRVITRGNSSLKLRPRPLADFGLEYEASWCAHPYAFRVSDSGGKWLNPGWEETVEKWQRQRELFPAIDAPTRAVRQLHLLWHPDWWAEAFVPLRAAA